MRVSSATSTRIISSPEPGTGCIGPPVAQVPASSKNRTGQTSERKNKFAATPDFLEPESGENLFFRGRLTLTDARMVMAPRVRREGVYRKFRDDAMALWKYLQPSVCMSFTSGTSGVRYP